MGNTGSLPTTISSGITTRGVPWALRRLTSCTRTCAVAVFVDVGSRDEVHGRSRGLSHLLEHLLFRGTEHYPAATGLAGAIEARGGMFNAFTTRECTAYHVQIGTDDAEFAVAVLADMMLRPKLREHDFEKEKGAVVEELQRQRDNPSSEVSSLLFETMFDAPYGPRVGGSVESVKSLSAESMREHFENHYGRLFIAVAGHLRPDDVERWIEHYFAALPGSRQTSGISRRPRPVLRAPSVGKQIRPTSQHHVCVAWPLFVVDREAQRESLAAHRLLATALGGTMSSPVFDFVRGTNQWAYSVRVRWMESQDVAAVVLHMGLRSTAAMEALEKTVRFIVEGELKDREIVVAREYLAKNIGNSLGDPMIHAVSLGDQGLERMHVPPPERRPFVALESVRDLIADTSPEAVRLAYRTTVTRSNTYVAYIGGTEL